MMKFSPFGQAANANSIPITQYCICQLDLLVVRGRSYITLFADPQGVAELQAVTNTFLSDFWLIFLVIHYQAQRIVGEMKD